MPVLDDGEVHLWRIALNAAPDDAAHLWPLLSIAEKVEAEKIVSSPHRARFVICRAAMRQILGLYLEKSPEEIFVARNGCNKLRLEGTSGGVPLFFNVSQSQDMAVLGITKNREIGVDIEAVRPVVQLERIIDRVLGPSERSAYFACEPRGQLEMFFHCWTQKKAYVKALAVPTRIPLDRVEVDFREGMPVQLRVSPDLASERNRVVVCDFLPKTDFCGAFAIQGTELPRVRTWNWCRSA